MMWASEGPGGKCGCDNCQARARRRSSSSGRGSRMVARRGSASCAGRIAQRLRPGDRAGPAHERRRAVADEDVVRRDVIV